DGNKTSPVRAGSLCQPPVNTAMLRQFRVMPLTNKFFQFGVHLRTCGYTGQKTPKYQHVFRRIHLQFHLVTKNPNKFELTFFDFAEAMKNTPVGVSLKGFSDYVQRTLCHALSDYMTCTLVRRCRGNLADTLPLSRIPFSPDN